MNFDVSNRVLTGSIDIEATPEKIWGLLTSTDEITNWYDEANNVTHLHPEGTFHVGSRFLLTRRGVPSWCLVTVMEPLRRLGWTEERDGKATVFVEFRLKALSGGRTRLTHTKALAQ